MDGPTFTDEIHRAPDLLLELKKAVDEDIDLVLESRAGDIACVEAKAAATLRSDDWRRLAKLRDARGGSFRAGVIVVSVAQATPLGDRLWAVPYNALWA